MPLPSPITMSDNGLVVGNTSVTYFILCIGTHRTRIRVLSIQLLGIHMQAGFNFWWNILYLTRYCQFTQQYKIHEILFVYMGWVWTSTVCLCPQVPLITAIYLLVNFSYSWKYTFFYKLASLNYCQENILSFV